MKFVDIPEKGVLINNLDQLEAEKIHLINKMERQKQFIFQFKDIHKINLQDLKFRLQWLDKIMVEMEDVIKHLQAYNLFTTESANLESQYERFETDYFRTRSEFTKKIFAMA